MKLIAFYILSLLLIDPNKIGKANKLKDEAKKAYLAGDYKTAITKYKYLRDTLGVNEEEVNMNLANAYFQVNDTTNATNSYLPLTQSSNSKIKSWANQQAGVVANRQGKFEEALNYFKQALKAEPNNDQARYNYEMVKKKLDEKKKQEQKQNQDKNNQDKKDDQKKDQQNKDQKDQKDKKDEQNKDQKDKDKKDQQNKDQQNKDKKDQQQKDKDQKDKEQKDKEQKEKEQQQKDQNKKDEKKDDKNPSLSDKMKDMKISEEKAKMILEAMKNNEVQYLQQNKRKATKPKDKGKPDW